MEESKKIPELVFIQQMLENEHDKFVKMSQLTPENQWQSNETTPTFISHFIINEEHNSVYTRGEGDIPASPQDICKLLNNIEQRIEYDEAVREARCLLKYNDNFQIHYSRMKAPVFLMDDRDWCFAHGVFQQPNGVIHIIQKTVEYPLPVPKGVTRGTLHLAGWILTPAGENKTRAIFIGCVDPNGNVPTFAKKIVMKQKARMILEMVDIFENKLKKK